MEKLFETEFSKCSGMLIDEFYEASDHDFISMVNGVDTSGSDVVNRAFDVLFRVMGKKIFCEEVYETLTSTKIITKIEFYDRYDSKCKSIISALSFLLSEYIVYDFNRASFAREYHIINANRLLILQLFKGDCHTSFNKGEVQITSDISLQTEQFNIVKNGLAISPSHISLASLTLSFDYNNNTGDDLTKYLFEFVETNWVQVFIDEIRKYGTLSEDDLTMVQQYLVGPTMSPQELILANMQSLFSSKQEIIEIENVFDILKEKLVSERDQDDPQIQYTILSNFEGSLTNLIPMLYTSSFILPSTFSRSSKRVLKLLTYLAPIKTIKR